MTGHFTLLMTDRSTKVGCAFLNNLIPKTFFKKQKRMVLFTCNYCSSNIVGLPSYEPGKPASKCLSTDKKFTNLCTNDIDPNDIYWY